MKYDHGKAEPFHRLFDQITEWANREFGDDDDASCAIARNAAHVEHAVHRLGSTSAAATFAESRAAWWLSVVRAWETLPFRAEFTPHDAARAIARELTHISEACAHGSSALLSLQTLTPALPHGWYALFKSPQPDIAKVSQWLGACLDAYPERVKVWADFMRAVGHGYDDHRDRDRERVRTPVVEPGVQPVRRNRWPETVFAEEMA
ncbi:MAG: hypothetical protein ABJE47_24210 [bacterium]